MPQCWPQLWARLVLINTFRLRQNGCRFTDDTLKCIFLSENVIISIEISLKYVSKGLINNIPELVQIMAWRRPGDKPLSQPMVKLLMHLCITLPQWVELSKCQIVLKKICFFTGILCHNSKLASRDSQFKFLFKKIRICLPDSVNGPVCWWPGVLY